MLTISSWTGAVDIRDSSRSGRLRRLVCQIKFRLGQIKNLFKHKKVRYKGLAKNEAQLFSLFGLANLVIAKRQLMALHA